MGILKLRNHGWPFSILAITKMALGVLLLASPTFATLEVIVSRIGFPSLRANAIARYGTWTPIVVDVSLVGETSFDGFIRVGQFDTDGDEVFDRVDLHLRAETGGHQQITLYALSNPIRSQGRYYVEVYDHKGKAVEVLPGPTYRVFPPEGYEVQHVDHDAVVILSISSQSLGRIKDLVSLDQLSLYHREPHIAHMSPASLPELWLGLEAVDHIIWDDAKPEELSERQRMALVEWVKQGGHLLIAASRSASSIKLTESIDAILPVDLGEVVLVDNLPEVRRTLLGPARGEEPFPTRRKNERFWWQGPFASPISMVETTLREGAFRFPDQAGYDSDVVTRRRLGRGQITYCSVTLQDLFSGEGSAVRFFQVLFDLRILDENEQISGNKVPLFPQVANAVAFISSGSAFLLIAGIFSVGYVLIATFGSWQILGARGWRHHSWTAFALIGALASVGSVFAVNAMRGFGETLHQISVVDMQAGSAMGQATALFGVKVGTDRVVDFWLPADPLGATEPGATPCFLRPLPPGNDSMDVASYSDPGAYRLMPGSAVVDDVRIRGTLKRFEGRWSGLVGGTVTGKVSIRGREILEGAYLINKLGYELKNCCILQTVLNPETSSGSRHAAIYAMPIGDFPSDGSRLDLYDRCYGKRVEESVKQYASRWTLENAQKSWSSEFQNALNPSRFGWNQQAMPTHGQEQNALLLLTTLGEYQPSQANAVRKLWGGARIWSRDRARTLEITHRLRRDNLVLLGFAQDPGPIRLFRRTGDRAYSALMPDPEKSWTMFRIDIPVTLVAGGDIDEDEDENVR